MAKQNPLRKKYSAIALLANYTDCTQDFITGDAAGGVVSVTFEILGLTGNKLVAALAELSADPTKEQTALPEEVRTFAKRLVEINAACQPFFAAGTDAEEQYKTLRTLMFGGDPGSIAFVNGITTIHKAAKAKIYEFPRAEALLGSGDGFEITDNGGLIPAQPIRSVDPNDDFAKFTIILNTISAQKTAGDFERNQDAVRRA